MENACSVDEDVPIVLKKMVSWSVMNALKEDTFLWKIDHALNVISGVKNVVRQDVRYSMKDMWSIWALVSWSVTQDVRSAILLTPEFALTANKDLYWTMEMMCA